MVMKKRQRLTEKETEVMSLLWQGEKTVRELLEGYEDPKPHFNTVSTTVRILVDKGFVEHCGERNGAYIYRATVSQSKMGRGTLSQVVKSYFNNDYFSAVSALVKEEKISADELRELIEMVESKHR